MIWQVYPRKAGAGQQPCTTEQAPVPCTFNFKKGGPPVIRPKYSGKEEENGTIKEKAFAAFCGADGVHNDVGYDADASLCSDIVHLRHQ